MAEEKVGTEQQVQQPTEQPEKKPEFALDENGNLIINEGEETVVAPGEVKEEEPMEDVGQSSEKEPEGQEQQTTETPTKPKEPEQDKKKEDQKEVVQPENEYYTKEEIQKIGIDKLDPNKIPEELVPFYKSMQADYTRKTQKLAEERKRLEEAKKEIERQARLIEMQAQTNLPLETLKTIMDETKAEVRAALGDEYDEFDPNVQAIIQSRMSERVLLHKQQEVAQQKLQAAEQHLKQNDPLYPQVEQVFRYIVQNELPLKQVEVLRAAQQVGDPTPFLEIYNIARERVLLAMEQDQRGQEGQPESSVAPQQKPEATSSKPTQTTGQSKKEPPRVESAGGDNPENTAPKVKPSDLAGRSTDEQAQLLIKLGLV